MAFLEKCPVLKVCSLSTRLHLTLVDRTLSFEVQRRVSLYQAASCKRNPLLLSLSQVELPSHTNPTGLVNLAFTWSSHFCPSECLAALGQPCWSVRVTQDWWVLSFHMGWKQHLLFHFQLPCAYHKGFKNTVGRTQNIVTKAAGISIFFPLLATLQPTWTTHSIHTHNVFSGYAFIQVVSSGPCSIPFWDPFFGVHSSKPRLYVISFRKSISFRQSTNPHEISHHLFSKALPALWVQTYTRLSFSD